MKNNPEQLYDLKEIHSLADGDDSFTEHMIKLFNAQIQTALPELTVMIECRNYVKVKTILHKMKPSIMVMGITAATEIILQIEQLELSDFDGPFFTELYNKLENILQEVDRQLQQI